MLLSLFMYVVSYLKFIWVQPKSDKNTYLSDNITLHVWSTHNWQNNKFTIYYYGLSDSSLLKQIKKQTYYRTDNIEVFL